LSSGFAAPRAFVGDSTRRAERVESARNVFVARVKVLTSRVERDCVA
jgi:hypothetical protein